MVHLDRKLILIGIGVVIILATFGLDYWYNYTNPVTEITEFSLPKTTPNPHRIYNYYKDGNLVGTYEQTLEPTAEGYTAAVKINVSPEGNKYIVESLLTVDKQVAPIRYNVNATINDVSSSISLKPNGTSYTLTYKAKTNSTNFNLETTKPIVLIDNNHPTHWELILTGLSLDPGKRYSFKAIVPQQNQIVALEIVQSDKIQNVYVEGVYYNCTVIYENNYDLKFYFSNGELVLFQNQSQNLEIRLSSSS